jgi:hypothetical protein
MKTDAIKTSSHSDHDVSKVHGESASHHSVPATKARSQQKPARHGQHPVERKNDHHNGEHHDEQVHAASHNANGADAGHHDHGEQDHGHGHDEHEEVADEGEPRGRKPRAKRLNLVLSEHVYQEVQESAKRRGTTVTSVLKRGLALGHLADREHAKGGKLAVIDADGVIHYILSS